MTQAEKEQGTVGALAFSLAARPKAAGSASSSSVKQEVPLPPTPPPPPLRRTVTAKQPPSKPSRKVTPPPAPPPESYIILEDDPMDSEETAAAAATSQQETVSIKKKPQTSIKEEPDWDPSPVATPTGEGEEEEEAHDQEVEEVIIESDSEDERKQCEMIMEGMDKLVAAEKLREERRAMVEGVDPSKTRFELLVNVRRLMQMTVSGDKKLTEDCDLTRGRTNPADVDQTTDDTATSLSGDKSQGERDQKKSLLTKRLRSYSCRKLARSWPQKALNPSTRSSMDSR
jgi:hypothetical protein